MAGVMPFQDRWPTVTELKSGSFSHLGRFADWCDQISDKAESAFGEVAQTVRRPGGVEWEGEAADAAIGRADLDLVKVRGWVWGHREAAVIARQGQDQLEAGQREALETVGDAERAGFKVGEDYRVTDTRGVSTRGELDARRAVAEAHSNFIRHRVGHLVANDIALTGRLKEATADFGNLTFEESPTTDDGKKRHVQPVDNKTHKDAPAPDPGMSRAQAAAGLKDVNERIKAHNDEIPSISTLPLSDPRRADFAIETNRLNAEKQQYLAVLPQQCPPAGVIGPNGANLPGVPAGHISEIPANSGQGWIYPLSPG
jgi:hypothetical protein